MAGMDEVTFQLHIGNVIFEGGCGVGGDTLHLVGPLKSAPCGAPQRGAMMVCVWQCWFCCVCGLCCVGGRQHRVWCVCGSL